MALLKEGSFEDDDDLEALRWAALQTLKRGTSQSHYTHTVKEHRISPVADIDLSRGEMSHSRQLRHQYHQHHLNSNLIAIVPTMHESLATSQLNVLQANKCRGGAMKFPTDKSVESGISKVEKEIVTEGSVSTKFTRIKDSSSNSSAEESEEENGSLLEAGFDDNIEPEPDPDVLVMKDEDEDSLEKLMDQLEQEMNEDTDNVIMEKHQDKMCNESKIMPSISNTDGLKCASLEKHRKIKNNSKYPRDTSCMSVENAKLVTNAPLHKDDASHGGTVNKKNNCSLVSSVSASHDSSPPCSQTLITCSKGDKILSTSLSKLLSSLSPATSPKRRVSPHVHSRRSRTNSPSEPPHKNSKPFSLKPRKSRSTSPRTKFYFIPQRSPRRSRTPRRSRSPHRSRSPCRSRSPRKRGSRSSLCSRSSRSPRNSRSPVRSSRSPRRRYPSPVRYNHAYSRSQAAASPRRKSLSPRARRPISPRRSVSPRRSISPRSRGPSPRRPVSPRRSPVSSRWQFSPRRQSLSPRFRRQSISPISRHAHSPRARRSVSPRRQSPFRRRFSRSPCRRNLSSPHRFSPPRRNPSPPRRRSSRSTSRSPRRTFSDRRRSPVRDRSPLPPRTFPRSPSPRRRASRSPIGRAGPRHPSPSSHKLSPWSSPRQQAPARQSPSNNNRYSSSPICKRKSPSPYRRQKKSNSPSKSHEKSTTYNRVQARNESKAQQSPRRDLRKVLQETRVNSVPKRSHSPRTSPVSNSRCNISSSPHLKSCSSSSSLSLSPSPERNLTDDSRRIKSPLRLHTMNIEFRSTSTVVNNFKEVSNGRQLSPAQNSDELFLRKQFKSKLNRKEPKSKPRKKNYTKGKDLKEKSIPVSTELPLNGSNVSMDIVDQRTLNKQELSGSEPKTELPSTSNSNASVLEARRRKFESSEPVELSGKKIMLKPKPSVDENQSHAVSTTSELPNSEQDDLDSLLDLELENAVNLWSSDDSLSDNEGRFKSSDKTGGTSTNNNKKVKVLPFTKLLTPVVTSRVNANNYKETKKSRYKFHKVSDEKPRSLFDTENGEQDQEVKSSEVTSITIKNEDPVEDTSEKAEKRTKTDSSELDTNLWHIDVNVESTSEPNSCKLENSNNTIFGAEEDKTTEEARGKEGDLRAELSRRRAERLTKVGSLHEILPARLVRSAFKDAVGTKNFKKIDRDRHMNAKNAESSKATEKMDGRRVLVLKSTAVERRVPSISVTIPKDGKRKENSCPIPKLPIHMRLGLPSSIIDERDGMTVKRRGSRKVKLKRNVTVTSSSGDKV